MSFEEAESLPISVYGKFLNSGLNTGNWLRGNELKMESAADEDQGLEEYRQAFVEQGLLSE